MSNWGTDLRNLGIAVIRMLWDGLKAGATSITGWIGNFAKGIVGIFKKVWGWFSPSSVMYEGGKALMEGLAAGIKDHAHKAQSAASNVAYKVGAGVQQWASVVAQALRLAGAPASLAGQVLFQMQTESSGNPNAINLTDCLTLDYGILTRRGWLRHDQVQAGDETIGYNPETQRNEWTPIIRVVHYDDAEVWRIGNKHWRADVTPNHRWWSDTVTTKSARGLTDCPECGWLPGTNRNPHFVPVKDLGKSVQNHRSRIHGLFADDKVTAYRGEFVRTSEMCGNHRIRVAAVADTAGLPGLSLEDVRVIAWLQGDGHLEPVLAKPVVCPECGWVPGTGRKPFRGPVAQPGNSVAVHRAKRHDMTKDRTTHGELAGYDGAIYQSKPPMVTKLRALLAHVEHTEHVRHRNSRHLPAHQFNLRRAYVTDLMKRSGVLDMGPEAFVLALSPDQRAAWLDSMIDAEGHRQPVAAIGARRGASGEFIRIAQVNGLLQDAIKLAVYLEGYRPTFSANSAERNGYQPAGMIGMARPHIAPVMFASHEVLERQPVWCVTTELGTWTTRGGDDLPFLTGNSNAAAGIPSKGLLAHAGHRSNLPGVRRVASRPRYLGSAGEHLRRDQVRPGRLRSQPDGGRPWPRLRSRLRPRHRECATRLGVGRRVRPRAGQLPRRRAGCADGQPSASSCAIWRSCAGWAQSG